MVRLDREQLIEHITNEILKRIDLSGLQGSLASRSLVIVDESPFGHKIDICEQIKDIHKRESVCKVICLTDNDWDGYFKDNCEITTLKGDAHDYGIYRTIERVESIYVLNFTVSNASRICMLSDDNLVVRAVQYSMLKGKKVFVSDFSSGFDCSKVNKAYLDQIKSLSTQLSSFGINIMQQYAESGIKEDKQEAVQVKSISGRTSRKIICLEDVKGCTAGTLEIGSNSIITPLALDYIRDKNIKISET